METIRQLFSMTDRPAFCVEDGIITAVNDAAAARQLHPGEPLAPLLRSGREALSEFTQGFLCLTLSLCGQDIPAMVTAMEGRLIFTLEPEQVREELRLLALASEALREPLGDVMSLVENLQADPDQLAQVSRGLHRMLRLIGNMTPHPKSRMVLMDVNELLRELWDRSMSVCESRGIEFRFVPHDTPVYSLVDRELLERAFYNLLSNAIRHAERGSISLQLRMSRKQYQICLYNSGSTLSRMGQDPFAGFLREPGMGAPGRGMGMGLRLVHSAASVHGGSVLMTESSKGGVQVVMSLPVQQDVSQVKTPRLQISYAGDHDPMLVELSDVLPPEFYR